MSYVLQTQPGAITSLEPRVRLHTKGLPVNAKFALESGAPLHFLGVSQPVGTCARGRRTHVAVFGLNAPGDPSFRTVRDALPLSAFEVLCRTLTKEEFRRAREEIDSDCLLGVEWLERVAVREIQGGVLVTLRWTGELQVYVNLV